MSGRVAAAPFVAFAWLLAGGPAAANDAAVDYMLHCRGCHLADGSGAAGRVPALRDHVGRFLQIPGGREYLIQVPGSAQAPLEDAELAAVLNWIVEAFGPADVAAAFEPFGADEVARHRATPLVDVEQRRRELLAESMTPDSK
jgi:hypothetical protein